MKQANAARRELKCAVGTHAHQGQRRLACSPSADHLSDLWATQRQPPDLL